MSGVKVYCRFRPQNAHEVQHSGEVCVQATPTAASIDLSYTAKPGDEGVAEFTFDRVFSAGSEQADVFEEVAAPLVKDALAGYNCTVLAYGQTGSGKTHTMEGPEGGMGEGGREAGVLPRIAERLFVREEEEGEGEGEGKEGEAGESRRGCQAVLLPSCAVLTNSPLLFSRMFSCLSSSFFSNSDHLNVRNRDLPRAHRRPPRLLLRFLQEAALLRPPEDPRGRLGRRLPRGRRSEARDFS